MANPIRDLIFGTVNPKKELVEVIVPRRNFNDVILPPATRRALDHALGQIKKHDLIFHQWGLAERHNSGLGLAFNFAGPPGTGKTVCAEAIAHELKKGLLVVRYSEMESLWAGETGKNVAAVFRAAMEQDAVLFFDEADAIAGRRFSSVTQGYQREANTVVNVLLKELEEFSGVVIFATNLAANFDPAFERRIRTHILFEMPGPKEREQIWQVQLHARKTPLAADVDFKALAEKFEGSGGDIKNAVLKAAQMATAEPGPDNEKRIHQRHFITGMQDVVASKKVMEQSIFEGDGSHASSQAAMTGLNGAWSQLSRNQETIEEDVGDLAQRLGELERKSLALPGIVERFDDASRSAQIQMRAEIVSRLDELAAASDAQKTALHEYSTKIDATHQAAAQAHEAATQAGEAAAHANQLVAKTTELATRSSDSLAQLAPQVEGVQAAQTELGAQLKNTRYEHDELQKRHDQLFTSVATRQEETHHALEQIRTVAAQHWRFIGIALIGLIAVFAGTVTAFLRMIHN